MEYHDNNEVIESTSYNSDVEIENDNEPETYAYSGDVHLEDKPSDSESVPDTQTETSKESSGKKYSETCNINQVVIDKSYFGRTSKLPELVDEYSEVYLSGKNVPPIKLERNTNKLIDGYHRYESLRRINRLCRQGKVNRDDLPKVFDGELIRVEYVEIPEGVAPRLFSCTCNMGHGQKSSKEDVKAAVEAQFEYNPSCTVKELSRFFGVSEDTARRYAENAIKERKKNRDAFIIKSDEEGKTQQQIEKSLKELFPGVSGTSQATISNILSKNRKLSKIDKTKAVKNNGDSESSYVQNTVVKTDEENKVELPLESVPKEFDSNSLNTEPPVGSNVPEKPEAYDEDTLESDSEIEKTAPDNECLSNLDKQLETLIKRIKSLSTVKKAKMLTSIEELLTDVE